MPELYDAGSQPVEENAAHKSNNTSTEAAMVVAEAATASALQSVGQQEGLARKSVSVAGTDGEADFSSDSGSDRGIGLGAALPQGFRLSTSNDNNSGSETGNTEEPASLHSRLTQLVTEQVAQVMPMLCR